MNEDVPLSTNNRIVQVGDSFHIENLATTAASGAFGCTVKGQSRQRHHRQALQSIHDLHKANKPLSQAFMNEVMSGTNKIVTMKTKRERVQRWLVNQRNADNTSDERKVTKKKVMSIIGEYLRKAKFTGIESANSPMASMERMDMCCLGTDNYNCSSQTS